MSHKIESRHPSTSASLEVSPFNTSSIIISTNGVNGNNPNDSKGIHFAPNESWPSPSVLITA